GSGQRARELDDAGLVRHADQRPFDLLHGLPVQVGRGLLPEQAVVDQLLAKRVAVDAEHLARPKLVALRLAHHDLQHGTFHGLDHHVVDGPGPRAFEVAEIAFEIAGDGFVDAVVVPAHAASLRSRSGASPDSGAGVSASSRIAASCSSADSIRKKRARNASAPGRPARYQPTCFLAVRTPTNSPWNA